MYSAGLVWGPIAKPRGRVFRRVLRCNLCGQTFTAPVPEGVGAKKYDETVPAMLAVLCSSKPHLENAAHPPLRYRHLAWLTDSYRHEVWTSGAQVFTNVHISQAKSKSHRHVVSYVGPMPSQGEQLMSTIQGPVNDIGTGPARKRLQS